MQRVVLAPCPRCSREIEFLYTTDTIPFFSEIMIMSAACECGYHFTDTILLREKGPNRCTLSVEGTSDLECRVVRSSSGIIEIPEFGILVEPGPACEAFISNVEGVLSRLEEGVGRVLVWAEDEEKERTLALLATLNDAREGKVPFTLILSDPRGNSAIIGDKVLEEPYQPEMQAE